MYDKSFSNIANMLKIFNEDNIVHFDENLLLFSTIANCSRGDTVYNSSFYVYTKAGQLINEPVNLVGKLLDEYGKLRGYVFSLADKYSYKELDNCEVRNTILLYIVDKTESIVDNYFNESFETNVMDFNNMKFISNSLVEIDTKVELDETVKLYRYNRDYKLRYNHKEYLFSNEVWMDNNLAIRYDNIGIFAYRRGY